MNPRRPTIAAGCAGILVFMLSGGPAAAAPTTSPVSSDRLIRVSVSPPKGAPPSATPVVAEAETTPGAPAEALLAVRVDGQPGTVDSQSTDPAIYRTMSPDELKSEIGRMLESLDKLPAADPGRKDVEGLIMALQARLKGGVDIQKLVSDIAAKVVELRGQKLTEPIKFAVLDPAGLRAILDMELAREYPGTALSDMETCFKLLGALPDRTDLRRTLVSLLSEQVAGLYDPRGKRLYVMRQFDLGRAIAKVILAHEICHALQDQKYDLMSLPIRSPGDDDRQMAAQALIEGDATVLMQQYAAGAFSAENLPELLDVFRVDQKALNASPYFLQRMLIFPYLSGAEFLARTGGDVDGAKRDRMFRNPPESTEQILHPDKYSGPKADHPTSFTLPDFSERMGPRWRLSYRNSFGEFQIRTLFETWREWDVAARAADGWGGDRYTLYRSPDDFTLIWATAWDTESDARDFFRLFSELMRAKKYKSAYAGVPFPENAESATLRTLPADGGGQTSAATPVLLRFRRDGRRVLVTIAGSAEAMAKAAELEPDAMAAIPK